MAGHEWEDWFEREEFIGQISDIRVQNLQVERELVQKRTFTRWMNLHLEKCDPPVEVHDLFRDIQDGHVLMALLEELSGCKLLHGFKKSSHRIFRLNNIAKVLSFLEERNVKLVSIDAADVADGNSSIILGLIWNIILFFQIKELTGNIRSQFPSSCSLSSIPTDSDASFTPSKERQRESSAMREHSKAIKKLLHWVQKRTRKYGVAVKDFGKSWTSGLAFLAVIKSIDSSLVDMRKAMLRSTKENLEDAFRIAHYSLGIPRLLEPEDVTINAPDEQSIMTYVSQFLEHFPGMEEPEETGQLIARSVSMGRLNFRDTESSHTRNGAHCSRVKERSYMFQRGCAQAPPKILISSVSEDRSIISPPFRPPAARSWSSEDFLADHPHMGHVSSSVVEEPKESSSEVFTDSNSPQLSYTHPPTVLESVNTESVIGDSAISSPDSWVGSEFGGMPEKFCESRSDSSLCDSGLAWDVYRATPVEVTNFDEGCILSLEDRAHDEQSVTESYIDEGIYSLSSLESNQERFQGQSDKNLVDVGKAVIFDNQDAAFRQLSDHCKTEINKEVDSQPTDTSQSREQEPGLCDAEELTNSLVGNHPETDKSDESQLKQTSEEESTAQEQKCLRNVEAQAQEGQLNGQTESQNGRNNYDSVITECPKDSLLEEFGILQEWTDAAEHTQDDASEGVLRDNQDTQESFSSETLANTHPSSRDGSSKTTLDQESGVNIPLISVSSEPRGQDDEERQDDAGNDEPEATDTGVIILQNELGCDSNDNVEIPSCLVSETPTASEQIENTEIQHLEENEPSKSWNKEMGGQDSSDKLGISETRQECESDHNSQLVDAEKDLILQISPTEAESQSMNTDQERVSADQLLGHENKMGDASSVSEVASAQEDILDPVNLNDTTSKPDSVSRDLFNSDVDLNPPSEDVVADRFEPMDLFYPDKEESEFPEPLDTEMQSWPSVLSVSALQPAPTSETQPDQPLSLLGEDFRDSEKKKVINQEDNKASADQEHGLFPGEEMAAIWSGDALEDSSENTESMSQSFIRQHEDQIAPVLRHRKGVRFNESTDNQMALTAGTRDRDNSDSDLWCNANWEISLLLLLWLLLYCFWLLPQIELKALPGLLLNLNH